MSRRHQALLAGEFDNLNDLLIKSYTQTRIWMWKGLREHADVIERKFLTWYAMGSTTTEIAQKMGMTTGEISNIKKRLVKRFRCEPQALVRIAIRGFLPCDPPGHYQKPVECGDPHSYIDPYARDDEFCEEVYLDRTDNPLVYTPKEQPIT